MLVQTVSVMTPDKAKLQHGNGYEK